MSATRWAKTLLAALERSGVRRVVVSPGSRSTPLAHAAATTPGLELTSVIDERSAGFFALGQARVTGEPSLLIATSGSAAAHYYPAVVEAKHAEIPLIVLTADRPFELQHAGAAQTMDQTHLFGRFAARFFELGTPDDHPAALEGLAHLAARAVHAAMEEAGVVHLNARFRKPFDPIPGEEAALLPVRLTQSPRILRTIETEVVARLAARLVAAERPLIVAGPMPAYASPSAALVGALARRLGAPVLAEAPSQLRFADLGPGVMRADRFDLYLDLPGAFDEVSPDLILELGGTPTSRSYASFLDAHPGLERVVLSPSADVDPRGTASLTARVSMSPTLESLLAQLPATERGSTWTGRFARWEMRAQAALELRASHPGSLGEGEIAEILVRSLPPEAWLMVGNSLPVRHLDRHVSSAASRVPVLSQRGLNGIDGLVSGAAGSAAASRRPLALLLGDVSFLHDVGGLLTARHIDTPLVIVAIHNDGGRIFEELPIAANDAAASHRHLWTTPHQIDFGGLAESYRLGYHRIGTKDALRGALAQAFNRAGASIIEAHVPPNEAQETWRSVRRVLSAVEAS